MFGLFRPWRAAARPARPRRYRPGFEALEDRCVPALTGPEFHVNTHTAGDQHSSASASASNGMHVAVWVRRYSDTLSQIRAQLFGANGRKLGGEILVTSHPGAKGSPDVAMDATGDVVVVWQEARQLAVHDVKGRRLSSAGKPVGNVFVVAGTGTAFEHDPSVAMDAAGNFVVAYQVRRTSSQPGRSQIHAVTYRSSGTALKRWVVTEATGFDINPPSVVRAPDGRFAIAYSNMGENNPDTQTIEIRRYSAVGSEMMRAQVPRPDQMFLSASELATDNAFNLVLAYGAVQFNEWDETQTSIYATTISARGTMSAPHLLHRPAYSNGIVTGVAMDRDGGRFAVVSNYTGNDSRDRVRVSEFTTAGVALSNVILGPALGDADVSINAADRYLVTFTSLVSRPNDPGKGIFGRYGRL